MFKALNLWFRSCFISISLHITHMHASLLTYLFPSKHVLIKIILNLFICNVNAKLLKGIFFEIFKAKYIQYANAQFITIPTGKLETLFWFLIYFFKRYYKSGYLRVCFCDLSKNLPAYTLKVKILIEKVSLHRTMQDKIGSINFNMKMVNIFLVLQKPLIYYLYI